MTDKLESMMSFVTHKNDEPPETKNNLILDFNSALFERVEERAVQEINQKMKEVHRTQKV